MSERLDPRPAAPGEAVGPVAPAHAGDAGATGETDVLDEVREAAVALIASLKRLVEAGERVVADPEAFAQLASSGRSVVEAFVEGLTAEHPSPAGGAEPDGVPEPGTD